MYLKSLVFNEIRTLLYEIENEGFGAEFCEAGDGHSVATDLRSGPAGETILIYGTSTAGDSRGLSLCGLDVGPGDD
jgi:hypothetical protein